MAEYELSVLYHPDLEIDIDKALSKVEKIIKDHDGKVVDLDNWGKRKLAYTIKKEDHAVYVFYKIELPGENVTKLEGILNITDEVLRYLIVKPGPEIEVDEEADEESDETSSEEKKDKEEKDESTQEDDAEQK